MDTYRRPHQSQAAADAIPLLVDNTYHLFHLTTPPDTVHHPPRLRSCWSRLRSVNLVNWTRDPKPVITPGENPTDPDTSGAWTGSAVLGPDERMNIFYTGYSLPQEGKQVVIRVTARDREGTIFDAKRQPIVIKATSDLSQFEDIDFRDPFVFFNESVGEFWMLVATRLRQGPYWTRGCIALLTSPDLQEWEVESSPLYAPGDIFCPECPELFTLPNGKWYLVYSRFAAPNAGTVYRVGDSAQGPFRTPRDGSYGRLDGRRWYAAKSCPKSGSPDKRIFFGWIADRCEEDGKWLWGGDLAIPREVYADAEGFLRIQPAAEVLVAFECLSSIVQSTAEAMLYLSSIGSTQVEFPKIMELANQSTDVLVQLKINRSDAASFGFVLNSDCELKAHRIQFVPAGNSTWTVLFLTDSIPYDDFWADQYALHIPRTVDGPEIVRHDGIIIDGPVSLFLHDNLVECFVGGRSMSFRLPSSTSSRTTSAHCPVSGILNGKGFQEKRRRVGLFVEDGTVAVDALVRLMLNNRNGVVAGPFPILNKNVL
ncbi:family 32 glycoside hydrolase [Xylariaceae sp. FL0662B]|nr:family 32 glycoside hydrolase [Xylariaceae sp. FL0662B]